ncbi:MAG: flavin monoamine oxidase family protein [Terricaulis sp.]
MNKTVGPSRRAALGMTAGVAGLAALPSAADAQARRPNTIDIVIVGAGFAGLTAARRLRAAGHAVVVLEADDRVGGRTKAGRIGGEVVDIGGQWVGPQQTSLLALAQELHVATEQQYTTGKNILDIAGYRAAYEGETPMLDPAAMQEFVEVITKIETFAAQMVLPNAWESPNAADFDSQTIESWLVANAQTPAVRTALRLLVRTVLSNEAGQVSMLALLAYSKAGGGFSSLIGTRGGAQDSYFVGGVWQLAQKMAAELGGAIMLNAPVTAIAQDDAGVIVTTPATEYRARYVIVTAPPPLAARIQYTPPMPAVRDGLTQRMPMGCVIKVHVAYARPFWRQRGLSGLVLSDRTEFGPWFDHSPQHGGGDLVGFFNGATAQKWADRDPAERRAQVLNDIALYFGPDALHPSDYLEEVWSANAVHRGGYVALPSPGTLTHFGPAIHAPVDRIHWAGTETADAWIGYIDGAIRSGERVATEVSAKM